MGGQIAEGACVYDPSRVDARRTGPEAVSDCCSVFAYTYPEIKIEPSLSVYLYRNNFENKGFDVKKYQAILATFKSFMTKNKWGIGSNSILVDDYTTDEKSGEEVLLLRLGKEVNGDSLLINTHIDTLAMFSRTNLFKVSLSTGRVWSHVANPHNDFRVSEPQAWKECGKMSVNKPT